MPFRKPVQKYSVIAVVFAAAAVAFGVRAIMRDSAGVGAASGIKAYFSTDDGKTWFSDDASRPFPFDHDGRPAYRAEIFRCGGTTFCAYLEALPDEERDAIAGLPVNWQARFAALQSASDQIMVKKPGDAAWVRPGHDTYAQITTPTCPDGSGSAPVPVNPNQ
jgi:hypothetical protein